MDRLPCNVCKQCNHKGKPSVTRFSKYCDNHYVKRVQTKKKLGFFTEVKNRFFDKRHDEKKNKLNTKGFRESWFWR